MAACPEILMAAQNYWEACRIVLKAVESNLQRMKDAKLSIVHERIE
jgi:hypothetical protein